VLGEEEEDGEDEDSCVDDDWRTRQKLHECDHD